MNTSALIPAGVKHLLRNTRDAVRRINQPRALRALADAPLKRIVIGSSGTNLQNWVATDQIVIDLLQESTWSEFFKPNTLDAILAEHVWEHLSAVQGVTAAETCFRYLKPGGYLRVAVPDGFHPDPDYIERAKPPADGHLMLYTHKSFGDLFTGCGFEVRLYEYFDETGNFNFAEWNPDNGRIKRSKRFDERNAGGKLAYTSVVLDAVKPLAPKVP